MTPLPDWCPKQEALLMKWGERAAGYRWLHNHTRLKLKRNSDILTYPSIIIASVTGVGGFAVLSPGGTQVSSSVLIIQYAFATLNVISGVLTSLSKFTNLQKLTEEHSIMAVQYAKFYRNIDMELSLEPKDRVPVLEFVNKCRTEYDRLLTDAPDIPAETIKAYNEAFPQKHNRPDICNGLSSINDEKIISQL